MRTIIILFLLLLCLVLTACDPNTVPSKGNPTATSSGTN
jgi:predicted small secreted protein